jgi:hypothetical protein
LHCTQAMLCLASVEGWDQSSVLDWMVLQVVD